MDPYLTLGLKPGASEEEAKIAFRKLAKTCHPDLHPDDPTAETRFKQINEAYNTIIRGGDPTEVPFRDFRSAGFNFWVDDIFGFDDILGRRARRNMDTLLECRLSLEELFRGKELTIQLPSGRASKITIPPGTPNGMRLTIPKAGSHNHPHLPPGDIHIIVHATPHARFNRQGNDLIMLQMVDVFDVLLGADMEIVGIDERSFQVNIPPGYDSSRRLRMAGQGMPDVYSGARGDLLIELVVQYPTLNDDQKQLLRQVVDAGKVAA